MRELHCQLCYSVIETWPARPGGIAASIKQGYARAAPFAWVFAPHARAGTGPARSPADSTPHLLSLTRPGPTIPRSVVSHPSRGNYPARRLARCFPATTSRRCAGVRRLPARRNRFKRWGLAGSHRDPTRSQTHCGSFPGRAAQPSERPLRQVDTSHVSGSPSEDRTRATRLRVARSAIKP